MYAHLDHWVLSVIEIFWKRHGKSFMVVYLSMFSNSERKDVPKHLLTMIGAIYVPSAGSLRFMEGT